MELTQELLALVNVGNVGNLEVGASGCASLILLISVCAHINLIKSDRCNRFLSISNPVS